MSILKCFTVIFLKRQKIHKNFGPQDLKDEYQKKPIEIRKKN